MANNHRCRNWDRLNLKNRFNWVFQKFIGVFTKKEHPLVIFLDDLQWVDSASLKLIQLLMTNQDSQHLLLIGAYRDNEVNATHPTIQTFEQIQQLGTRVNNITLQPLNVGHVNQLIADVLSCSIDRTQSLAELLFNKTNGNPFFLTQLLQSLYQENLLTFDFNTGCWQWDVERIQAVGITDNVVQLMVDKIEKLNESTQNVLKLAACIGNQFDLEVLSIVNEKSSSTTATELWSALQEGLILPLTNDYKIPMLWNQETKSDSNLETLPSFIPTSLSSINYKFLHDRVQQAAYNLIPENSRKEVHLKIGRLLKFNSKKYGLEENIFNVVDQLNTGEELIVNQPERDELAKLNLIAAKKAKAAVAYEPALRYLRIGLGLLTLDSWQYQYELTLAIYIEIVEAELINTHFEEADKLSDIALLQAKTLLEKVEMYELKIHSYLSRRQFKLAIETAMQVLEKLDSRLPEISTKPESLFSSIKRKLRLKGKRVEDLIDLPKMANPDNLAALRIMLSITPASNIVNPQLYKILIFTMVNLCIKYGNSSLAAASYASAVSSLVAMGEIDFAYQFSNLSLKIIGA